MSYNSIGTKLTYLMLGMGIGAAVALLFAPQSGEKTRKKIAEKAQEGKDFVASTGRELCKQAEDLVDQGKDLVSKQKARLADLLASGKQAARGTLVH